MIKLTVQLPSQKQSLSFDKDRLVVGSGQSVEVDIPLGDEAIFDEHFYFLVEDSKVFVENTHEDPLLLLNGESFQKEELKLGDRLDLGQAQITFEGMDSVEDAADISMSDDELSHLLEEIEDDSKGQDAQNSLEAGSLEEEQENEEPLKEEETRAFLEEDPLEELSLEDSQAQETSSSIEDSLEEEILKDLEQVETADSDKAELDQSLEEESFDAIFEDLDKSKEPAEDEQNSLESSSLEENDLDLLPEDLLQESKEEEDFSSLFEDIEAQGEEKQEQSLDDLVDSSILNDDLLGESSQDIKEEFGESDLSQEPSSELSEQEQESLDDLFSSSSQEEIESQEKGREEEVEEAVLEEAAVEDRENIGEETQGQDLSQDELAGLGDLFSQSSEEDVEEGLDTDSHENVFEKGEEETGLAGADLKDSTIEDGNAEASLEEEQGSEEIALQEIQDDELSAEDIFDEAPSQEDSKEEDFSSLFGALEQGPEDLFSGEEEPLETDANLDLDATLDELFSSAKDDKEEDFDIDSILVESESEEGTEEEEKTNTEDFHLLLDEDESDLESIQFEAANSYVEKAEPSTAVSDELIVASLGGDQDLLDIAGLSKDDVEFEDENFIFIEEEEEEEKDEFELLLGLKDARRYFTKVASFLAVFMLLVGVFSSMSYTYIKDQQAYLEELAARGMADLSMSFLHHQIYQKGEALDLKEPSFFENRVKPAIGEPFAENSPLKKDVFLSHLGYEVHFFFDRQKSRFLLLAIPTGTFLDLFISKPVFALDSDKMQVLRVDQVAPWKQAIRNKDYLDDFSSFALIDLMSQGDFIAIPALSEKKLSFILPESLEEIHADAPTYVYYAMRYFPQSKKLLDYAQSLLSEEKISREDIDSLLSLARGFSFVKEPILYLQPEHEKDAQKIYQLLSNQVPELPFHYARLIYDQESNDLQGSELMHFSNLDMQVSTSGSTEENFADLSQVGPGENPLQILIADEQSDRLESEKAKELDRELKSIIKQSQVYLENTLDKMKPLQLLTESERILEQMERQELVQRKKKAFLEEKIMQLYEKQLSQNSMEEKELFRELLLKHHLDIFLSHQMRLDLFSTESSSEILQRVDLFLDQVQVLDSLEILELFVKRISSFLDEGFIQDASEKHEYERRLREAVLEKLADLLFSAPFQLTKNQNNYEQRYFLEKILQSSKISSHKERVFYLQEFDELVSKYRTLPDTEEISHLRNINQTLSQHSSVDDLLSDEDKETLRLQYSYKLKALMEDEETLERAKGHLERLPIDSLYLSKISEAKVHLGRMGQQLLLLASSQEPGEERDLQLEDAIALIRADLEDNRGLWADILQARRLILDTSKVSIHEVLQAGLGFQPRDKSLLIAIKSTLTQYFDQKQKVFEIKDPYQFQAQYDLFKTMEIQSLQKILEKIAFVRAQFKKLEENIALYLRRLHEFAQDYQKAKLQGFFVKDQSMQSLMLARVGRKIYHTERLKNSIDKLVSFTLEAIAMHERVAKQEVLALEKQERASHESFQEQLARVHQVSYPNLVNEELQERFERIFNIQVSIR